MLHSLQWRPLAGYLLVGSTLLTLSASPVASSPPSGEKTPSAGTPYLETQHNRVSLSPSFTPARDAPVDVIIWLKEPGHTPVGERPQLRTGSRELRLRALKQRAALAQRRVIALLERSEARRLTPLWAINAVAATVRPDVLETIAELPEVARIAPDRRFRLPRAVPPPLPAAATDEDSAPEWNLERIQAPAVWSLGVTGEGAVVAGMDTGVDPAHPDLESRWRGGANSWFDPNGEHASPHDSDGHGTQTMGLMVGGDAGGTWIGVAPGAIWIAVKIFDDAGEATLSGVHEGFQWLLDPDGDPGTDDAPDVVANAWWLEGTTDTCVAEFDADIQALEAAGIAVLFAAGNEGPATASSVSPANAADVLPVGAIDADGGVADFSGRGPSACGGGLYPLIVAPGVSVRTADLSFGGAVPDPYTVVTGTSFAIPQAAGAVALLVSAFPDIPVSDQAAALITAAVDAGDAGADNAYGYGILDVAGGYALLEADDGGPPQNQPPQAVDDAAATRRRSPVTIAVLENDFDPDGTLVPESISLVEEPQHGQAATASDGTVRYSASPGYRGIDTFSYTAADDAGALSNPATVTVTIR